MEITQILINHMIEPMGFQLDDLRIQFKLDGAHDSSLEKQLIIYHDKKIVYQSLVESFETNYFDVVLQLTPRSHYDVEVVIYKKGHIVTSGQTFFETGKLTEEFDGKWIGNKNKELQHTLFKTVLNIEKKVLSARLYMTGLGVYETFINKEKVGDEYLAPGITAYDKWTQIQTYDITKYFKKSQEFELLISTGDGWYKGSLGYEDGGGGVENIYGDQHRVIAEYYLVYEDGTTEKIITNEDWLTTAGNITKSAIYYGEDLDDQIVIDNWEKVVLLSDTTYCLKDRLSLPLKIKEQLPVKELLTTPKNETVIDFGQNHAGWFEFYNREPKGTELIFQVGEILQEDNFYRDNLRTARAAFTYISDGEEKWVRPHFTYFGYRYVKVEGNTQVINSHDFKSSVIYSDMLSTGDIQTNHKKVNRLFQNVIWGQKSNFFDVPTDCRQRDERFGWTGDAEVFSKTAAFNMNVYPFFKKYVEDIRIEQNQLDGMTPMYAPAFGKTEGGAAVWGDAATIIPWNMYQIYGDSSILKQNYSEMKAWVNWITRHTTTKNLWTGMFQYGDWLALDGEDPNLPFGKTDDTFVASVYYYYSTSIVAKTAELLGNQSDYEEYSKKAEMIRKEIRNEFITNNGRLGIDTQTAYCLAIEFDIASEKEIPRLVDDLVSRLKKDKNTLQTGFVGTPLICGVLSKYGHHSLAMDLFLSEEFPSWLYAVNLDATTIWERWDSVLEDGSMNPKGMNSLNHYSFGAVMEWAYQFVLGIQKASVGFKKVKISPKFDHRLSSVKGYYETPYGPVKVDYDLTDKVTLHLSIPLGVTVEVELPSSTNKEIEVNQKMIRKGKFDLPSGKYEISYKY